jgi:hypothetical protein
VRCRGGCLLPRGRHAQHIKAQRLAGSAASAGDLTGTEAVALHDRHKPMQGRALSHSNVDCLRSSHTNWDAWTLWRTTSMLTDPEPVFAWLQV